MLLTAALSSVRGQSALEQAGELRGRVEFNGAPVAGSTVTLHRLSNQESGAIGTVVSAEDGAFSFPLEPADTSTIYFPTVVYQSVTFFGTPFRPGENVSDYVIAVYDTASAAPEPVRVVNRFTLLVTAPDGSWSVEEVVQILNPSGVALVNTGNIPPVGFGIPDRASNFEVGPDDVLPEEVTLVGNRVSLITPFVPGGRQMTFGYNLPAEGNATTIPIDLATDTFNLFVEQPSHLRSVEGLGYAEDVVPMGGRSFVRYVGVDLEPGDQIELTWGRPGGLIDPVIAAVSLTIVLLAASAFVAFRNRGASPA